MKDIIPIHKLKERSDAGMQLVRFEAGDSERGGPRGIHRDDHYIFLLQESGNSNFMLDFRELNVSGCCLLYILPGQVHQVLGTYTVTGWFLAIDQMLLTEEYRTVFEQHVVQNDPILLGEPEIAQLNSCLTLLQKHFENIDQLLNRQIVNSLALSFIGMIAGYYLQQNAMSGEQNSRPVQIGGQFRNLLLKHFKTEKSPAAYAAMLHLSLTYLNEVIKSRTGFPVSYWIHHEVVMEAKRLLFYTSLSVKEISAELGFTDHTYFSRLFTKMAGLSAGKFRNTYSGGSHE